MTLIEMLEKNFQACPSKPAVIYEDEILTYSELYHRSRILSKHFNDSGIAKGDRIAIMMDSKRPELIVSFLAIVASGGIAVPVDCNQTDAYILELFRIISPSAVVVSGRMHHRLDICELDLPSSRVIVCNSKEEKDQVTLLADIFSKNKRQHDNESIPLSEVPIDIHDVVYFNLTSGTTGFPKCAVTTHSNIYWNTLSAVETLGLTDEDVHLCMFPPSTHPHELFSRALFLGGTMVLTDTISPKSLTKVIEGNGVTAMMAIAPIYGNFTKIHLNNTFNFTSLRIAESGGMHVDPVTADEFHKRFNISIVPVWGSTETTGIALAMPVNGPKKVSSCGIPNKYYEVKIVDKNGEETLPGKEGEMIVSGPGVCGSYYQKNGEVNQNFRGGWYYTNDMFKKDEDGYFYFSGRKQGMMKVAGMKVFPVEIEDHLIQNPKIKEVAVTKINDPLHGEIPKAVIVLKEGCSLSKKEVRSYLISKIASYKIPKIFEFRNSLPRNPVGKILVNKL